MTPQERRALRRERATAFVKDVNSRTFCAVCGEQPVEWHHEDHPDRPNDRVSSLRAQGASNARIQREMDRCTPLCRIHHMTEDGRIDALRAAQPRQKGDVITKPEPCVCCGRLAKPRRNEMCVTCDNHHSGRRLRKTRSCDGCCRA